MKIKMREDKPISPDGVSVIDAKAGDVIDLPREDQALKLIEEGAAEKASKSDETKSQGDADENKGGGDNGQGENEEPAPLPTAEQLLAMTRAELEKLYDGDGSKAPNKAALVDAIIAARESAD
jgi:hypothetical protein